MRKAKKILLVSLILLSFMFILKIPAVTNISNAATETTRKSIKNSDITVTINTNDKKYTGKKITTSVKLYNGTKKLKINKDYTTTYENNKYIGKATVIVKGIGKYKGTIKKKFYIKPKTPELYTVKVYKYSGAKIHWKKDKKVDGYKIYMRTGKDGEYKKIATITDNSVTRYIKMDLDQDTYYYFKVVSYKVVNGKTIYSKHSNRIRKELPSRLLAETTLTSPTSGASRNTNLRLASRAVNGTVLKPGERFVWSRVVGEATKAKGYKDAIVFANKQKKLGTGGGVCQVSSTLFQTARKCKLKIIERHPHSLPVSYTTKGNDATVSYGVQNLIFQNNKSYSIRIEAFSNGGSTTCKMYRM